MNIPGFNTDDFDTEQRSFNGIESPGIYRFGIISSEKEEDTDKSTWALIVEHEVIEPAEHAGKTFKQWLNFVHPNADHERIANEQIAKLCLATECKPREPGDLVNKTWTGKMGPSKPYDKRQADGSMKRIEGRLEVKWYYDPAKGPVPDALVTEAPVPANDNRSAAAAPNRGAGNTNTTAAATPRAAGARPWKK